MLISMAYAQEVVADAAGEVAAEAPSMTSALVSNFGLIAVMVAMFYLLLIRPQQKRFKEHKSMLDALKKGDKIITSGGLIGKVDKIKDESEVVVDLGGGVKVTALRHTIQNVMDKDDTKK